MLKRLLFYLLFLVVVARLPAHAQTPLRFALADLPAQVLGRAGQPLRMAAQGGINAPQFSDGDIDGDGRKELFWLDRPASKAHVYRRARGPIDGWEPAADLEAILPPLDNWALLRDYNADGRADIFTATQGGNVRLWRNVAGPVGPAFMLKSDSLRSSLLSGAAAPVFVLTSDLPAIEDVDGDGDLDIITFAYYGATVDLHRNISDGLGSLESIQFKKIPCWGSFAENFTACNRYAFGTSCRAGLEDDPAPVMRPAVSNHIGSALTLADVDVDGDQDLLLADITCNTLNLMRNTGSLATAMITDCTTAYPRAGRPPVMNIFPAGYKADADGDGLTDLLVAPNIAGSSYGLATDLTRSSWLYRNLAGSPTAAPLWTYQTDDYLQGEMIDEGSDAAPALIDITADGYPDLILGADERRRPDQAIYAGLSLFKGGPGGTLALADTDLLGFAARGLEAAFPVVADFSGDGVADLGLVHSAGFARNVLIYYPTLTAAGPNGLALDAANPDTIHYQLYAGTRPTFADLNGDRLPDMVLGRDDGVLQYAINTGSPGAPAYPTTVSNYLGSTGGGNLYSPGVSVADFNGNGLPDLLVAYSNANLRFYADPIWQPNYTAAPDTDFLFTAQLPYLAPYNAGRWQFPLAADMDGDTLPDVLLGTTAGGVVYLQNHLRKPLAVRSIQQPKAQARLLANPSMAPTLILAQPSTITLQDALGRLIYQSTKPAGTHTLPAPIAIGLYAITIKQEGRSPTTLRWVRE